MYVSSVVVIDLNRLEKFKKEIPKQLNGGAGPVADALKLWGVRYRSYAQLRFDTYSKGGGDWPKLSPATLKKRRKGTKSNVKKLREILAGQSTKKRVPGQALTPSIQPTILRDTGLLFGALAPVFAGAPGAIEEHIEFGIRVGYGGPQRHFSPGVKVMSTIADIASYHQTGNMPRMPKREIIVSPPETVLNSMSQDMTKALDELADK